MFQSKGLISQVAMVESRADQAKGFKKKINLPAAIFNRSPIRDSQAKPGLKSITPSRKSITATGVSPLKSRRQESVVVNENLNLSNSSLPFTRKSHSSREAAVCQSHQNKIAKYYVCSDDETLMYCEKCAILLASQGFKVVKIEEAGMVMGQQQQQQEGLDVLDNHPRRVEISRFLSDLDKLVEHIGRQKAQSEGEVERVESQHLEQVERVNNFYQYLFESLQNHKETVIEALEQDKAEAQAAVRKSYQTLDECISDCNLMKQDVLGSIQVIRAAQQRAFRPVMQSYKQKLSIFRMTSNEFPKQSTQVKQVIFNDVQQIGKRLLQSIQVRLQQPETNEDLQLIESQQKQSSVYFSFDNPSANASNRKSEEENPVMQQSSEEERMLRGSLMKKGSRKCFEEEEEEEEAVYGQEDEDEEQQ